MSINWQRINNTGLSVQWNIAGSQTEWEATTCYCVDGPCKQYSEQKKPGTKDYLLHNPVYTKARNREMMMGACICECAQSHRTVLFG